MISNHYLYNYIESAVNLTNRPVYCASRLEIIPPSFPACEIIEIERRDQGAINLCRTDIMKSVTWEVRAYSNKTVGAVDEAYDIIEDADKAFARLGFQQTYCHPIDNADPTIYRLVARWTRLIGDGDEFPVTALPEPDPEPEPDPTPDPEPDTP